MTEEIITKIEFYCDGSCSGNHRPGVKNSAMGVGIIGKSGEFYREWSVYLGPGTNQQAELHSVRIALEKVRDRETTDVTVCSDSQYVIGLLTQGWIAKTNQQLVKRVRALVGECKSFKMKKIAGHSGHAENDRADELAVQASKNGK